MLRPALLSAWLALLPITAMADSLTAVDQVGLLPVPGGNIAMISQTGTGNAAATGQFGVGNTIRLNQAGNHNQASIQQFGSAGSVTYQQQGSGLGVSITQTGSHPPPVIVTQGRRG